MSLEVKSEKGSGPTKRKPDLISLDNDSLQEETNDSNKKQNAGISSIDNNDMLISEVGGSKDVNENENENVRLQGDENKDVEEDGDDDDEDEDEEEDYEAEGDDIDDDDEEEEEDYHDSDDDHSNGNADTVDLKGKGIMRDVKGKGKLIEESDDSIDRGSESDGDSDLSDDPLAEIDLDNILPSRIRRRVVQPGIRISSNQGSKEENDDNNS